MKIAIPTNDGLTICALLEPDSSYLVLTLELGEIVHQEMRKRNLPTTSGTRTSLETLNDCSVIIARGIPEDLVSLLQQQEKVMVRTEETIITSAFMQYMGSAYKNESNLCCCP